MSRKIDTCKKTLEARQRNVIVISDTHAGCRFAVCPEGVVLDGGMIYEPSQMIKKLYLWWKEFWFEWVPKVTHGEPFSVVHVGDAFEGRHHGSTSQISQNLSDQAKIAEALLRPIVAMCDGHYYHIRGTEAHVGPSGEDEERLARSIGAMPDQYGNYSRHELYKEFGGALCHFAHHIGSSGSSSYESTAVYKEMVESFVEAGRWKQRTPQIIVRAHRHRQFEVRIAVADGYGIGLVLPGWQLKTPFSYRLGMKMSEPQIGGYIIRRGDEELYTRFFVKHITPDIGA